jgi:hypothetical protein
MRVSRSTAIAALLVTALLAASAPLVHAQFRFKVHNKTRHTIVSLVASESGEEAGEFDVGAGIGPGKTMTLEWDRSTDDSNCEWAFSAVYDDGSYSEPVIINFCEDDLELVFEP